MLWSAGAVPVPEAGSRRRGGKGRRSQVPVCRLSAQDALGGSLREEHSTGPRPARLASAEEVKKGLGHAKRGKTERPLPGPERPAHPGGSRWV